MDDAAQAERFRSSDRASRQIFHIAHGEPGAVLAVRAAPPPSPQDGAIIVRVTHAPIHPGDLAMIAGNPNGGRPAVIGAEGRVPGFEGVGIIESIAPAGIRAGRLAPGMRVAFFPANGAWQSRTMVAPFAIVPVPDGVPDGVAAQLLINTLTACLVVRAALRASPASLSGAILLQTAAGSAVGKLITILALESGLQPVRLVRSRSGAEALAGLGLSGDIIATDQPDWSERLGDSIGDRPVHAAVDAVGGAMTAALARHVSDDGTVVAYGALDPGPSDMRSFVPRRLTLKGVSLSAWMMEPEAQRARDVETALRLAKDRPDLFAVSRAYPPEEIAAAVEAVAAPGKPGTVLLKF